MNVVLVDDSQIVRERVADIISGFPKARIVGEAGNFTDAVQIIDETKPDVVILDIKLPGENGVELLQKLRKDFPAQKIIMLTNYPYLQYKLECFKYGADYFLSKSDEFDKLPEILLDIANGR